MDKNGFEFSFAWMFAVLVGAVIIFLAIYGVTRLINKEEYKTSTTTAKQISIIFEPMTIGLEEGKKPVPITLKEETKLYNRCSDEGAFGKQQFSLSRKGFGGKWTDEGGKISVTNKYVFSDEEEQGKVMNFFSLPFNMPWKVSEVIFLTSKDYCFKDAPENIKELVEDLDLQNIKFENCSKSINVCFGYGNCDINVRGTCLDCEDEYEYGYISKGKDKLTYSGNLIYGAIFSDKEVYECNIKRLMKRAIQQALIYKDEGDFLSINCGTSTPAGLLQIISSAKELKSSDGLLLVNSFSKQLDEENSAVKCNLW